MSDWNPALYTRFEAERTQPARDLLARVPLDHPGSVLDLGCGPGNSTELLASRDPAATIIGLDSSPAMVAAARKRLPSLRFEQADILIWQPATPPDLIFANAVLQWLPDPIGVMERLLGVLAPGGVLAVQMPDNLDEPSHTLMRSVAAEEPWRLALAATAARRKPLPDAGSVYDRLCGPARTLDIWRTTYQHVMPSARHIVDWVRSTGLKPFLDALSGDEPTQFAARYEAEIAEHYPARADGTRLFAFPRLFIVCRTAGTS